MVINSRTGRIDGAQDNGERFYAYAPEGSGDELLPALRQAGVTITAKPANENQSPFWQIFISCSRCCC